MFAHLHKEGVKQRSLRLDTLVKLTLHLPTCRRWVEVTWESVSRESRSRRSRRSDSKAEAVPSRPERPSRCSPIARRALGSNHREAGGTSRLSANQYVEPRARGLGPSPRCTPLHAARSLRCRAPCRPPSRCRSTSPRDRLLPRPPTALLLLRPPTLTFFPSSRMRFAPSFSVRPLRGFTSLFGGSGE